jgi:hypothetical protein
LFKISLGFVRTLNNEIFFPNIPFTIYKRKFILKVYSLFIK